MLYCRACVVILCFSLFFQKLFKVKAIPKDEEALVDESAEGAKMDAMVNEPQEEIEMIEEGTNGPQTKESLVGEGDDDGEQGDDDGEQGDDDGEGPLRLGDLKKVWVPMRMDGTNDFVACCGYEASRLKGTSLDNATPELWRKAQKHGWRMLLMPPQFPGEDDLSLVPVRRADCEKDESEALARCRDYETKEARKKKET